MFRLRSGFPGADEFFCLVDDQQHFGIPVARQAQQLVQRVAQTSCAVEPDFLCAVGIDGFECLLQRPLEFPQGLATGANDIQDQPFPQVAFQARNDPRLDQG